MAISPEFSKVFSSEAVCITASNGIECKLPLSEEEFKEILSSSVAVSLTDVECFNKQIKYSGRAIFTVTYKSEGGIKKQENGVEFSFKCDFDKCLEGMTCLSSVKSDNVKVNYLNGITMASAVIIFSGEISKPYEVNYFVKEPSLNVKTQAVEYSSEVCKLKRDLKVEEEFDLDFLVQDVLSHQEKVSLASCVCGIGVIIVDGEVELKLLASPLEEGKEPSVVTKIIPFRMEAECQDAIPEYLASVYLNVKSANIKVYVDEAKNKSAVSVEINLDANAKIISYSSFTMAVDAYSSECEIKLNCEDKKLYKALDYKCLEEKLKSEISFLAPENARLIGVINDKIEEIKCSTSSGEALIEGALAITALFYNDGYIAETALVPFSTKIKLGGNKCELVKAEAIGVSLTKSSVEFTLKVCYLDLEEFSLKVVSEVQEGQKKAKNTSAISVYVASQGDSLWDVSKALSVKEEDILKTNENLTFPLESSERIVVYREK